MSTDQLALEVATLKAKLDALKEREILLQKVGAAFGALVLGVLGYTNFESVPNQARAVASEEAKNYFKQKEVDKDIEMIKLARSEGEALVAKLKAASTPPAWETLVGAKVLDQAFYAPQYRLIAPDTVQLRGHGKFDSKVADIGFLPKNLAPPKRIRFNARCGNLICMIAVHPDGRISAARDQVDDDWVSLDGVQFSISADIGPPAVQPATPAGAR